MKPIKMSENILVRRDRVFLPSNAGRLDGTPNPPAAPIISIGPGGIGNYTQREYRENDVPGINLMCMVLFGALLAAHHDGEEPTFPSWHVKLNGDK